MQVRHELPADDRIPLRVAVRYALYGVVLTKPFDEPVDLDEYRVNASPTSPLYGLDEVAGYKKRCDLLNKLLEEVREYTFRMSGYTPDLGGKLIFSWSDSRSFRKNCVVNEDNSEVFEISEKYIEYIDSTIPYYEYDIHYEMKDRYRHWTKLTVEREKFLGFMENMGLVGESRIDVESRSDDVVLTLQERSGEAVERIFTEVRRPADRLKPPLKNQDSPIKAAPEAPELKQETGQRKSVQRSKTATKNKLIELYPDGLPPNMSLKQIENDIEKSGLVISDATVRRALGEMGWRVPSVKPRP